MFSVKTGSMFFSTQASNSEPIAAAEAIFSFDSGHLPFSKSRSSSRRCSKLSKPARLRQFAVHSLGHPSMASIFFASLAILIVSGTRLLSAERQDIMPSPSFANKRATLSAIEPTSVEPEQANISFSVRTVCSFADIFSSFQFKPVKFPANYICPPLLQLYMPTSILSIGSRFFCCFFSILMEITGKTRIIYHVANNSEELS